jgi:hypothetical protein
MNDRSEPKYTIEVERMHMRILLHLSAVVGPIDTAQVVAIMKGLEKIGVEFACPKRYVWHGELDPVTRKPLA